MEKFRTQVAPTPVRETGFLCDLDSEVGDLFHDGKTRVLFGPRRAHEVRVVYRRLRRVVRGVFEESADRPSDPRCLDVPVTSLPQTSKSRVLSMKLRGHPPPPTSTPQDSPVSGLSVSIGQEVHRSLAAEGPGVLPGVPSRRPSRSGDRGSYRGRGGPGGRDGRSV